MFFRSSTGVAGEAFPPVSGLKPLHGRFGVGFIDVEWDDVQELLEVAGSNEAERVKLVGDDLPLILARIYYPSTIETRNIPETLRGPWIPSSHYFPGYGYFLRLPTLVSSGMTRLMASHVKLWAVEGIPLQPSLHPKHRLPVAVFSHGLGGIRTTYATLCCELASRGIVVVALEHRDGSASLTVSGPQRRAIPYAAGPSGVTQPMIDYAYRAAQLKRRRAEMRSTFNFLKTLNKAGDSCAAKLVSRHLPGQLDMFKEHLELEHIAAIGHSFGATTCLAAAQDNCHISACIAYDPWMYPLPQDGLQIVRTTNLVTLIVQNERFAWHENDSAVLAFVRALQDQPKLSVGLIKMLGCGHMDQSDLTSIIPPRVIRFLRPQAVIHPNPHHILNVSAGLALGALVEAFPEHDFQCSHSLAEIESALTSEKPTEHEHQIQSDFSIVHFNVLHNFRKDE